MGGSSNSDSSDHGRGWAGNGWATSDGWGDNAGVYQDKNYNDRSRNDWATSDGYYNGASDYSSRTGES